MTAPSSPPTGHHHRPYYVAGVARCGCQLHFGRLLDEADRDALVIDLPPRPSLSHPENSDLAAVVAVMREQQRQHAALRVRHINRAGGAR